MPIPFSQIYPFNDSDIKDYKDIDSGVFTSEDGDLKIVEFERSDRSTIYMEGDILKGMLGMSDSDVMNLLEESYEREFTDLEYNSMEYGNGWVVLFAGD